jgi:hypothetical protein
MSDKRINIGKLTGLVECPLCERIFTTCSWTQHKWNELNRRSTNAKPVFKGHDGVYRCVVPGCLYAGTVNHKCFKIHVAKHPLSDLQTAPYPVEVRNRIYSNASKL